MSSKTGCIGEARTIAKAVDQNFEVYMPFGNHQRYDLIIDGGSLHRVQVKATSLFIESKSGGRYLAQLSHGDKNLYTKADIDYFIVYVLPMDSFYVIPVEAITKPSCYFYPHRNNPKGFYEKWNEAWGVLK